MFKKISISLKVTIMVVLVLTLCVIGLTTIINLEANYMVSEVAMTTTPAIEVPKDSQNDNVIDEEINDISMAETSEVNIQEIKNNFYLKSILCMVVIITIGGISCYYIIKKSLNPLIRLNEQVKNMKITNLSQKIDIPSSQDEVTELAKSFDNLTKKLNDAFNFQTQFSANVAHELRTPLTIIKTKIGVFNKKSKHTTEEYKKLVSTLEKEITHLSTIIQNLLEITSTNEIIEKEVISVSDIMNDIICELGTISHKKDISISTEYNDIEIYGNIDLLYRAFYNLIENAIKYNKKGGKIKILAKKYDSKNIMIQIVDTGIGIPKEMQKNIFEPFYCVDKSRSREIGGVGLGLSIVRNIVEKHNGTITVSSNTPHGSIFSIILPKN